MVHLNSDLSFIIPVVTATVAVDSNGGEEDEENEVDNPEEVGVHLGKPELHTNEEQSACRRADMDEHEESSGHRRLTR